MNSRRFRRLFDLYQLSTRCRPAGCGTMVNHGLSSVPLVADTYGVIKVRSARVNIVKNLDGEISKRWLTVFTEASGSGKSSLVF
ncbi:hypothetical protein CMUST_01810 [Corynebacterium mustelae]|uniref:Uncharacterized protein n=1 Tax=Corynebacterium mustelae TaxID=571915 RepID=A0A0G3GU84_9CORY|nr:hypothetical protein [Corynebacterium mustelae]AKK04711.1 hypothetical protein CMUST_01810 [Corynebacterium mustelae]